MKYYIGRIHNEDVLKILKEENEFSFDSPGANKILTEDRIKKWTEKYRITRSEDYSGMKSFRGMLNCEPDTLILMLGTNHWDAGDAVDGGTIIGYGLTRENPYRFEDGGDYWRHRLRFKSLALFLKGDSPMPYLHINNFPTDVKTLRSRFYKDHQGIVESIVSNLGGLLEPEATKSLLMVRIGKKSGNLSLWRDDTAPLEKEGKPVTLKKVPYPKIQAGKVEDRIKPGLAFAKGIDYDLKHRYLSQRGRAGERAVVEYEKRILISKNLPDLAEKVELVAETKGDGLGFDILSFNEDGSEKHIEVKTTRGDSNEPFFLTNHEIEHSKKYSQCYVLYRIYDWGKDPKFFEIYGNIEETSCHIVPSEYRCYPE